MSKTDITNEKGHSERREKRDSAVDAPAADAAAIAAARAAVKRYWRPRSVEGFARFRSSLGRFDRERGAGCRKLGRLHRLDRQGCSLGRRSSWRLAEVRHWDLVQDCPADGEQVKLSLLSRKRLRWVGICECTKETGSGVVWGQQEHRVDVDAGCGHIQKEMESLRSAGSLTAADHRQFGLGVAAVGRCAHRFLDC